MPNAPFEYNTGGWNITITPNDLLIGALTETGIKTATQKRYKALVQNGETTHRPIINTTEKGVNDFGVWLYQKQIITEQKTMFDALTKLKTYLQTISEHKIPPEEPTPNPENYFTEKLGFNVKTMAEEIMSKKKFVTIKDTHEIFYFNGQIYEPAEHTIKTEVKHNLQQKAKIQREKETKAYIQASTFIDREKIEPPINFLPLENGVYDFTTKKLREHSPAFFFTWQIPVTYDETATCPIIHKFLDEVVDQKDKETLLEFAGYCLYRKLPIQKAIVLLGDGSNGKSTFIRVLKTFLGSKNISGVALQELGQRFAKSRLYTKLANVYPDLDEKAFNNVGAFQMLTGDDPIESEKKFRDAFTFDNYAKMIFSCNVLPEVNVDTDAFWRRWILIHFPKKFTKETSDQNLTEKMTTKQEMSGLLNEALSRLPKLLERKDFVSGKETGLIREDYLRKSSPLQGFLMDEVQKDPNNWVATDEIYTAYINYCMKKDLPACMQGVFLKKLLTIMPLSPQRKTIDGVRKQGYLGLKLTILPEFFDEPNEQKKL